MTLAQQSTFAFVDATTWGGARDNAGRKKKHGHVPHAPRRSVCKSHLRLVTTKLCAGLPSLRSPDGGEVCVEAIRAAQRPDFRIHHFSIQHDHLHLVLAADSGDALARGMKSLCTRIARNVNQRWGRAGRVFAQRFHDEVLKSLGRLWHALRYVLCNHNKHGSGAGRATVVPDLFSSGRYFDGWSDFPADWDPRARGSHVAPPPWTLRECVKRYGRFSLHFTPKPRVTRAA
ncbi:MAG: transposase [Planctomycetes bacterium]|nr:transposase [Planctomycetota bacterium]